MDIQQQIEHHEAEIRMLKDLQGQCVHEWGAAYQDYDEKRVAIT